MISLRTLTSIPIRLLSLILVSLTVTVVFSGCSPSSEISLNTPTPSESSGAGVHASPEHLVASSNDDDTEPAPTFADTVKITDIPTPAAALPTFEELCRRIERLPNAVGQSGAEVSAACEQMLEALLGAFGSSKVYDSDDLQLLSFENGYYIKIHPTVTAYADGFRIIEFGNGYLPEGLAQHVLVQVFYDIWDKKTSEWMPNIYCQHVQSYYTGCTETEFLLSASFSGDWYTADLVLVSARLDYGDFGGTSVNVRVLSQESHWQDLQYWEPVPQTILGADVHGWSFGTLKDPDGTEAENGYAVSCSRHGGEERVLPLSFEDMMAGRAFRLTCPYEESHTLTILPNHNFSSLIEADGAEIPMVLAPAEFGVYYSYDEEKDEVVEDPSGTIYDIGDFMGGCGWWCVAARDTIVTSSVSENPLDLSRSSFRETPLLQTKGSGEGDWIRYRTIYAIAGYLDWDEDLWSLDEEPGMKFGLYEIGIINGNAAGKEDWAAYSRAKTVNVYLDGVLFCRLNLADVPEYQIFRLSIPIVSQFYVPFEVMFEIADTYPGTNGRTAIADINIVPAIGH